MDRINVITANIVSDTSIKFKNLENSWYDIVDYEEFINIFDDEDYDSNTYLIVDVTEELSDLVNKIKNKDIKIIKHKF